MHSSIQLLVFFITQKRRKMLYGFLMIMEIDRNLNNWWEYFYPFYKLEIEGK